MDVVPEMRTMPGYEVANVPALGLASGVRMYTIEAQLAVVKVRDAQAKYDKAAAERMEAVDVETKAMEARSKAVHAFNAAHLELQAAIHEYDAGPFTSKAATRVVEATR